MYSFAIFLVSQVYTQASSLLVPRRQSLTVGIPSQVSHHGRMLLMLHQLCGVNKATLSEPFMVMLLGRIRLHKN